MNRIEDFAKILDEIAETEGFKTYQIKQGNTSIKGDGYTGVVNGVQITNGTKSLHLVIKCAHRNDALRKDEFLENLYGRESYLYKTVFPAFDQFEKERGVAFSKFAPGFYKSELELRNEAIILEDLKTQNFWLIERRSRMGHDYVKVVMEQYGRYHALSLALRDQKPKLFEQLTEPIHTFFLEMMERIALPAALKKKSIKTRDALVGYVSAEGLDRYDAFVDNIENILADVENDQDQYSVILHGDCWTNNMMFRSKTDYNKPDEVRFIDFQLSRLGSVVVDLAYFFYACSSSEVINNHKRYLRIYHDSLSRHLKSLGSDPETAYPYKILEEQWSRFAKYGLLLSILIIHIMVSESDETVDMVEASESGKDWGDVFDYEISGLDKYNERIREIIKHCLDNNYI